MIPEPKVPSLTIHGQLHEMGQKIKNKNRSCGVCNLDQFRPKKETGLKKMQLGLDKINRNVSGGQDDNDDKTCESAFQDKKTKTFYSSKAVTSL